MSKASFPIAKGDSPGPDRKILTDALASLEFSGVPRERRQLRFWQDAIRTIWRTHAASQAVIRSNVTNVDFFQASFDPAPEPVGHGSWFQDYCSYWLDQSVHVAATFPRLRIADDTSLVLFGERFDWQRDPVLGVVLKHGHFSLLGYGDSHAEAAAMLVERTIELAEALAPAPGEDSPPLDEGGRRLQEYLTHVLDTVENL